MIKFKVEVLVFLIFEKCGVFMAVIILLICANFRNIIQVTYNG